MNEMQGGQQRRRPHCYNLLDEYIDGGRGGYGGRDRSGGFNRGPYERSNHTYASSSAPRLRTVKEAMETNVLLAKEQYLDMDDVNLSNDPVEVQDQAFEAYKESHRRIALERFFLGHKDEAWFVERYIGDDFEKECNFVKDKYCKFIEEYRTGILSNLKLDFNSTDFELGGDETASSMKIIPLSASLPEHLAGVSLERFGDVLTLGNIPPNVKKASLESLLRDSCEHFCHLYVSEPVYEKSLYRNGFATFNEGADLNSLALKLENILVDGSKIYYSVQKSFTRQVKIVSSDFNSKERLEKDLEQSTKLLEVLCSRYDVELINWNEEDLTKKLDFNIACLRNVFNLCYYSGIKCSDPLELQKICGDICLRSTNEPTGQTPDQLDPKIADLIRLYGNPFELATEDNLIESKFVIKLEELRFRCSLCSKLFKGPEFVIKHVRLKHEEESNAALQQLSLLNLFLARPSPCAFLRTSLPRSTSHSNSYSSSRHRQPYERQPPSDADLRQSRRPVKEYVDWDAPAAGEVEINYD